jgi:hypothetical protein
LTIRRSLSQEDWEKLLDKHGKMQKALPAWLSSYRKKSYGKFFQMKNTGTITGISRELLNTTIIISGSRTDKKNGLKAMKLSVQQANIYFLHSE